MSDPVSLDRLSKAALKPTAENVEPNQTVDRHSELRIPHAPVTIPLNRDSFAYTPCYCEENVYHLISRLCDSPPKSEVLTSLPRINGVEYRNSDYSEYFAVFITNPTNTALLYAQKSSTAGAAQGHFVVWDYHVIAVVKGPTSRGGENTPSVVLDFDSRLGFVTPAEEYFFATFRPDITHNPLNRDLCSRFRVVPSRTFLANFASDRSHMLLPATPNMADEPDSQEVEVTNQRMYAMPPPPTPLVQGHEARERVEACNLFDKFLNVKNSDELMDESSLREDRYGRVMDYNELLGFLGV